ncbi:MAG: hypothetical protein HUU23_16815 [Caldilineales bacterium]|nr:hypothetical protein [Caldilineales bacterium]
MTTLPITRMTLYKHGVGFFERRASCQSDHVDLTFPVAAMNDVLKSLTAFDWGGGQVLGLAYDTPRSREERLAGCSVRLSDDRSLTDLVKSLRGRQVTLLLDQQETRAGLLVGLEQAPAQEPLATALVSVLDEAAAQVHTFPLGRVLGIAIADERGSNDLRFFLTASLAQESHRQVRIHLSPGDHDLSVSYVAPAPTWRVSYRLIFEADQALLQGWGIFDNTLEEDLNQIGLALTAGMPVSFVYDLYAPFTPERPRLKEEGRVAAAPVQFAESRKTRAMTLGAAAAEAAPSPGAPPSLDALAAASLVSTATEDLGELFQYQIQTPVTVGRGQSAMAPILAARLTASKDLLYNGSKQPQHPVATLRLRNESGLTLERGPVTVIDAGQYVGEALLPFTPAGGEIVTPFAVELGVKIQESGEQRRVIHALNLQGAYLRIEEWDIRERTYRASNATTEAKRVLIEHARSSQYELFDSPAPQEQTDLHLRFALETPPQAEGTLRVQERRLLSRREELRKQSYAGLQRFLQAGLLDRQTHDQVAALLGLWEKVEGEKARLADLERERQGLYEQQRQFQSNMQALGASGKEGALRSRYVDQMAATTDHLQAIAEAETAARDQIKQLEEEIAQKLAA